MQKKVGRPKDSKSYRVKAAILELKPLLPKAIAVMQSALDETNDLGNPTQKALDTATFIHDYVNGKARQSVDMTSKGKQIATTIVVPAFDDAVAVPYDKIKGK